MNTNIIISSNTGEIFYSASRTKSFLKKMRSKFINHHIEELKDIKINYNPLLFSKSFFDFYDIPEAFKLYLENKKDVIIFFSQMKEKDITNAVLFYSFIGSKKMMGIVLLAFFQKMYRVSESEELRTYSIYKNFYNLVSSLRGKISSSDIESIECIGRFALFTKKMIHCNRTFSSFLRTPTLLQIINDRKGDNITKAIYFYFLKYYCYLLLHSLFVDALSSIKRECVIKQIKSIFESLDEKDNLRLSLIKKIKKSAYKSTLFCESMGVDFFRKVILDEKNNISDFTFIVEDYPMSEYILEDVEVTSFYFKNNYDFLGTGRFRLNKVFLSSFEEVNIIIDGCTPENKFSVKIEGIYNSFGHSIIVDRKNFEGFMKIILSEREKWDITIPTYLSFCWCLLYGRVFSNNESVPQKYCCVEKCESIFFKDLLLKDDRWWCLSGDSIAVEDLRSEEDYFNLFRKSKTIVGKIIEHRRKKISLFLHKKKYSSFILEKFIV